MQVAFDTSVLVAALVASHPMHARAMAWVSAAVRREIVGECSWHAVAETWSVLTRLPTSPPISGAMADIALGRLTERVVPVALEAEVYRAAIRRCAERGLRSGALFDALHLLCAEAAGAEVFLTFNPSDFIRLSRDGGPEITVPPDPPGLR